MMIGLLRIFVIVCAAYVCGKLVSKVKLPAILGWLIAGIVFGPYLAGVVTLDITQTVLLQKHCYLLLPLMTLSV